MAEHSVGKGTLMNGGHANFTQTFNENHYAILPQDTLLDALKFPASGLREQTVAAQCRGTCEWFLETAEYLDWIGHADASNRMLWILGKAGSGKSTLLKFAIEQARAHAAESDLLLTHFFNARGGILEKTVEGMYRTILVQIINALGPLSAALLSNVRGWMPSKEGSWPIPTLISLLKTAIRMLEGRQLVFFIDALDECDNEEAQEMVEGFESLIEEAASNGQKFRVCFASRPYPHIATHFAAYFRLDCSESHVDDIKEYIEKHLRIGQSPAQDAVTRREEIKEQLLLKSEHVFLWAKLVVNLLNKEYRNGTPERYRRWLQGSLGDLDKLYMEIWSQDNEFCDEEDKRAQIVCLQWALYHIDHGGVPTLDPRELWWGIQLGLGKDVGAIYGKSRELDDAAIRRYITSTSKGFIEFHDVFSIDETYEGDSGRNDIHTLDSLQVSFIHESAREFILSDKGPLSLGGSKDRADLALQGHLRLRDCGESLLEYCLLQPNNVFGVSWDNITNFIDSVQELELSLPLFHYARFTIFHHADTVQRLQPDDGTHGEWTVKFYARFKALSKVFSFTAPAGETEVSLFNILVTYGLGALMRTTWQVLFEEAYDARSRRDSPGISDHQGDQLIMRKILGNKNVEAVRVVTEIYLRLETRHDSVQGILTSLAGRWHAGDCSRSWIGAPGARTDCTFPDGLFSVAEFSDDLATFLLIALIPAGIRFSDYEAEALQRAVREGYNSARSHVLQYDIPTKFFQSPPRNDVEAWDADQEELELLKLSATFEALHLGEISDSESEPDELY